jgi:hypothetical protein
MAAKIERKAFDKPDETRPFQDGKGKVDVVTVGEHTVGRGTLDGVGRNTLNRSLEPRHAKRRTPAMFSKDAWS